MVFAARLRPKAFVPCERGFEGLSAAFFTPPRARAGSTRPRRNEAPARRPLRGHHPQLQANWATACPTAPYGRSMRIASMPGHSQPPTAALPATRRMRRRAHASARAWPSRTHGYTHCLDPDRVATMPRFRLQAYCPEASRSDSGTNSPGSGRVVQAEALCVAGSLPG